MKPVCVGLSDSSELCNGVITTQCTSTLVVEHEIARLTLIMLKSNSCFPRSDLHSPWLRRLICEHSCRGPPFSSCMNGPTRKPRHSCNRAERFLRYLFFFPLFCGPERKLPALVCTCVSDSRSKLHTAAVCNLKHPLS